MDFDTWWNQVEIFAGEGAMGAAEQAWDYQQAEIDELEQIAKGLRDERKTYSRLVKTQQAEIDKLKKLVEHQHKIILRELLY